MNFLMLTLVQFKGQLMALCYLLCLSHFLQTLLRQQLMQMTTTSLAVEKKRKKRLKIELKRPKLQCKGF